MQSPPLREPRYQHGVGRPKTYGQLCFEAARNARRTFIQELQQVRKFPPELEQERVQVHQYLVNLTETMYKADRETACLMIDATFAAPHKTDLDREEEERLGATQARLQNRRSSKPRTAQPSDR